MLGPSSPQNLATVIKRARDDKGRPVGKANPNPLLDTREYIVELMDGTRDKYFANQIAENLWSQCDAEGRQHAVFSEIVDHRKNARAICKDDGFERGPNGQRRPKKTTVGWDLLVEWKDGSCDWVLLKELKEGN